MIIEEFVIINNRRFKHTYSSDQKYIKQMETDVIYNEAYDTLKNNYHYTETDETISEEDVPQE